MIDRGGDACFVLQTRSVIDFAAEIVAQQFQRDLAIEQRIARFVNRAHAADAERFQEHEIIERALDSNFLAAARTIDARERLDRRCVNQRAASGTRLRKRRLLVRSHRFRL